MSRTLALDAKGDLMFDELHQILIISGIQKINQDITVIIRSAIGSLTTDPNFGTDLETMVMSRGSESIISGLLRSALLSYPEVSKVDAINIVANGCVLQISITVTTKTGDSVAVEVSV